MKQVTPPNGHMPQQPGPAREFAMRFTSTPRGARLARRLVSHRLDAWGYPYDSDANATLTLIAAELTANAVRHGHVPGRDFHLRLAATPYVLRIEVSDTRGDRCPASDSPAPPPTDAEAGRGLLLVAHLADCWGVRSRDAAPGKCVWAVLGTCSAGTPPVPPAEEPAVQA
ncbi:ATP-binding protein [Streptomyces sp. S1A1-8]|nr:ATP-binding protein [Streptomyces sp. S1A1-7]QDN97725.1 ATP-binding protein [Streptomyces sp. RLB1-9]QDO19432.1 ATP-binding protein [Streptomyces sp. S1A1-8]QDO29558.1 ATP-binding protein [Streptomyces sp. S1A1-3]